MKTLRELTRWCLYFVGASWVLIGVLGVASVNALAVTFGGVCLIVATELSGGYTP